MTQITPAVIAELRALAGKATPRPRETFFQHGRHIVIGTKKHCTCMILNDGRDEPLKQDNSALIVAAVNHLDALLDAAEGMRWVPVSEGLPAEGEYVRVLAKGVRYHLGAWYWETPDHDEHENPEPYRQWEVFYDMENRMIPLDEPPTHFSRSPLPEPPEPQGE